VNEMPHGVTTKQRMVDFNSLLKLLNGLVAALLT